jgi:hypothetical protein
LGDGVWDSNAEGCVEGVVAADFYAVHDVGFGGVHPARQNRHVKPKLHQPLALLINNPLNPADMRQKCVRDDAQALRNQCFSTA